MVKKTKIEKNKSKKIFSFRKINLIFAMLITAFLTAMLANYAITQPEQKFLPEQESGNVIDLSKLELCDRFNLESDSLIQEINLSKKWVLVGNVTNEEMSKLDISVTLSKKSGRYFDATRPIALTYEIKDTQVKGTLTQDTDIYTYKSETDLSTLAPGVYSVIISSFFPCQEIKLTSTEFNVSQPIYVAWSFDWEGYDVNQQYLDDMKYISDTYSMPMTHFFNPRLLMTASVSQERKNYLLSWVTDRINNNGDSMGLHMHGLYDFVEAAGVEKSTTPRWGDNTTDGYDIPISNYSYEDMVKLLNYANNLFELYGIPQPKFFRAGGWFANQNVLMAIRDTGYLADSSGRTYYKIGNYGVPGFWNLQTTTQPYQINLYDQNTAGEPYLGIWEFPNNGADSWAFTQDQMIKRFTDNYSGGIAQEKKLVVYLSHPHWFYVDKQKMIDIFTYIQQYKYSEDNGPVVYINMDQAYSIWTSN